MYHIYNGPPDGQYIVCAAEAILDNCFTRLVFCGVFPLAASFSKTVNIMEGNGNS